MKATPLTIPDVVVVKYPVFDDVCGFCFERFNQVRFQEAIGKAFTPTKVLA